MTAEPVEGNQCLISLQAFILTRSCCSVFISVHSGFYEFLPAFSHFCFLCICCSRVPQTLLYFRYFSMKLSPRPVLFYSLCFLKRTQQSPVFLLPPVP